MRRLSSKEGGFTLPEMLVTIMVMMIVFFALYSIFDMSIKVFRFGNDKVEAVENARLGLERMERELRAAYPYDKPSGSAGSYRLWSPTNPSTAQVPTPNSQQITFGNDLDGDRMIKGDESTEQITYQVSSTGPVYTLQRRVGSGTPEPLVEFVGEFPPGGSANKGLRFTPLTRNDGTPSNDREIAKVKVELLINKDGRNQTLLTEVQLRNQGG